MSGYLSLLFFTIAIICLGTHAKEDEELKKVFKNFGENLWKELDQFDSFPEKDSDAVNVQQKLEPVLFSRRRRSFSDNAGEQQIGETNLDGNQNNLNDAFSDLSSEREVPKLPETNALISEQMMNKSSDQDKSAISQSEIAPKPEQFQNSVVAHRQLQELPPVKAESNQAVPVENNVPQQAAPVENNVVQQAVPAQNNIPLQAAPVQKPAVPAENNVQAAPIQNNVPQLAVPVQNNVVQQAAPVENNVVQQAAPVENNVVQQAVPIQNNVQAAPVQNNVPQLAVPVLNIVPQRKAPAQNNVPQQVVPVQSNVQQVVPVQNNVPQQQAPIQNNVQPHLVPAENNGLIQPAQAENNGLQQQAKTQNTLPEHQEPVKSNQQQQSPVQAQSNNGLVYDSEQNSLNNPVLNSNDQSNNLNPVGDHVQINQQGKSQIDQGGLPSNQQNYPVAKPDQGRQMIDNGGLYAEPQNRQMIDNGGLPADQQKPGLIDGDGQYVDKHRLQMNETKSPSEFNMINKLQPVDITDHKPDTKLPGEPPKVYATSQPARPGQISVSPSKVDSSSKAPFFRTSTLRNGPKDSDRSQEFGKPDDGWYYNQEIDDSLHQGVTESEKHAGKEMLMSAHHFDIPLGAFAGAKMFNNDLWQKNRKQYLRNKKSETFEPMSMALFYSWIALATLAVLAILTVFRHRHKVTGYVYDLRHWHNGGYVEEGRRLLHNAYA